MLQLDFVISDLVHQVCPFVAEASPIILGRHLRYNQKWRRWWWRRQPHSSRLAILLDVLSFLLFCFHNFFVQISVHICFCMFLHLLHDCFLHDDVHNFFIFQVLFGKLKIIKELLPFWRNVFKIECTGLHIEGN